MKLIPWSVVGLACLYLAACGSTPNAADLAAPVSAATAPVVPTAAQMQAAQATMLPATPVVATSAPSAPTPTIAPTTAPTAVAVVNIRAKGDPNAPVKIIEYSDFQCPLCASFVRETLPQLEQEYVDTGIVYLEYRDLPLANVHGSAVLAAHAANCAAEQGNFFGMHDKLFQGQDSGEWGGGDLSQDFTTFLGYARDLGLDDAALLSCVQSQRFRTQIEDEYREGVAAGAIGTPTFLVNGELLSGAQPFAVFKRAIDKALERAGQ